MEKQKIIGSDKIEREGSDSIVIIKYYDEGLAVENYIGENSAGTVYLYWEEWEKIREAVDKVIKEIKEDKVIASEMEEEDEGIYWRCECGFEDSDYNVVQMHAEREHGKGTVIEKVVGNWNYPYIV